MRLRRYAVGAVAVIVLAWSAFAIAQSMVEREARAISALNHPCICTLYDIGHQDGIDFLVMEFLEGESLAERLKKGALSLKKTLKIGIDVCEALIGGVFLDAGYDAARLVVERAWQARLHAPARPPSDAKTAEP